MSVAELTENVTETDPVIRWRLEELLRAGYSSVDAAVLSTCSDVDLHLATRLLQDGCPATTALRILL